MLAQLVCETEGDGRCECLRWLARLSFAPLTHFSVCRRRASSEQHSPAVLWVKSTPSNAPLWSRMWHRVARWGRAAVLTPVLKVYALISLCSERHAKKSRRMQTRTEDWHTRISFSVLYCSGSMSGFNAQLSRRSSIRKSHFLRCGCFIWRVFRDLKW